MTVFSSCGDDDDPVNNGQEQGKDDDDKDDDEDDKDDDEDDKGNDDDDSAEYDDYFSYDTYPKTLEDFKIVFPVTAECTSIDQSVARDWDWPETIDKVCRVSAIVRGISADDARKYIDKVKKEVAFTTQDEESVAGYTKFEGTREKVIIGDKEFEIGYNIIFTEEYMTVSFEITHIHYV